MIDGEAERNRSVTSEGFRNCKVKGWREKDVCGCKVFRGVVSEDLGTGKEGDEKG